MYSAIRRCEQFLRTGADLSLITERRRYVSELTNAFCQNDAEQRIPHLGCSVSIRVDGLKVSPNRILDHERLLELALQVKRATRTRREATWRQMLRPVV